MNSRFDSVECAPPIDVLQVRLDYRDDKSENKVDLGIGVYRTEEGEPWVLPVVKKSELQLVSDKDFNHEYLLLLGLESFSTAATRLLFGENSTVLCEGRAFGVQAVGGTGALRLGAEFLYRVMKYSTIYSSVPFWDHHYKIFEHSGFNNLKTYQYWDTASRSLNIDGLLTDLSNAPENSVILLQVCAHNPTGCDPSKEQWKQIAEVMKRKNLFPFFDSAYQGFATGDLIEDSWPVRYFAENGFELFCAQSFAKNMGLYGERVGNLSVVTNNPENISNIISQLNTIARPLYQSPPSFGVKIANIILNNQQLIEEWNQSMSIMTNRIRKARKDLKDHLQKLATPGTWDHITNQIGMFSYLGLSKNQARHLINKWHIHLLPSGRVNICGITPKNVHYIAKAIHDAVTNVLD